MVQIFQRYLPFTTLVDFVVQSLLCTVSFAVAVQVAWWARLDPTLPVLFGLRAGRVLTSAAILVLVFFLTGYFERRHHLSTSMYLPRLLQSVPLAAVTLALLYQFVPTVALSWQVSGGGLLLMTTLMIGWHALAPVAIRKGALAENILILGGGPLAAQIVERVRDVTPWGFQVAGYIPIREDRAVHKASQPAAAIGELLTGTEAKPALESADPSQAQVLPFPVVERPDATSLGRIQDLDDIINGHDIHTLVVALDDRRGKLPLASMVNAKLRGIAVYDAIDFYERLTGRMLVARLRPSSIIFSEGFSPGRLTMAAKRVLDILAATMLLIVSAPVQIMVAIAVAASSKGPVLFRQERVGLNGVPFTMLKYRSMRTDAEDAGPQWAAEGDDRVTPVGSFLRKSRLDELPQLWNIFAGQMSFVGPRPERPCFVRSLREQIPYYDQRHAVRPGLTGWAQVKIAYGASVEDSLGKLEYDLYYIKRLAVAFDITIITETVRVLLTARGSR